MPEPEMPKPTWYRRLIFILIFLATNALAYITLPLFITPATDSIKHTSGSSLIFPIYYIVAIILFTVVFINLARKRKLSLLKALVGVLLTYSIFVILLIDFSFFYLIPDLSITIISTALLIFFSFRGKRPAIYILGIVLGAGVAAVLSSIITIQITIIIMAIFSVYDYLSVNVSKSMIEVAETAMDSNLPLLFSAGEGDDKIAMGFGDTVLPTFALMSVLINISYIAYFLSLTITILSFIPMMYFASKKPQPGLPYMMNAIFIGLIIYYIFIYLLH